MKKGREDFSSKGSLSYISLGHHKNKDAARANESMRFKESFLTHSDSQHLQNTLGGSYMFRDESGLNATKFGIGFTRRLENNIFNPAKEELMQRQQEVQQRSMNLNQHRLDSLKKLDARTGFNIITGSLKGDGPGKVKVEGKRKCPTDLAPETIRNGQIQLRDSMLKFYAPQASGHRAHFRQKVLLEEGIKDQRFSSVIQQGKKDIFSYGIEDNFAKSQYQENNEITKRGLFEVKIPGKYTPRKQPFNPSGYKAIVDRWTSDIKGAFKPDHGLPDRSTVELSHH